LINKLTFATPVKSAISQNSSEKKPLLMPRPPKGQIGANTFELAFRQVKSIGYGQTSTVIWTT
jgi:hypothetical protein